MEAFIRPPEPLAYSDNMTKNWQNWKKDFMIFMKASNSTSKPMNEKAYLLRSYIGVHGRDVIEKIVVNNESARDNMDILLKKLDEHFKPLKNEVVERYNFFNSFKKRNESMADYVTTLTEKAKTCNFGKIADTLIRDKIIVELKDQELLKKLFDEKNLNLPKLITIYNDHIQNKKQTMSKYNNNTALNANPSRNYNQPGNIQHRRNCRNCNTKHPIRECPAWGVKCEKCGAYNHYTQCCPHDSLENGKKEKPNMNVNTNVQQGNPSHCPTAPPLLHPPFNPMYPNLEYMRGTNQTGMVPTAWEAQFWEEDGRKKINNNVQRSEALPSPKEEGAHAGRKSSKSECIVS